MHLQRRPTFDHESVRNGAKLSQTAQPTIEVTGDDGPGLRWLFDILVHDRAAAARGAARPQDHERQTLTELAAVTDPAACRFALTGASLRIAASSLRAYNALRPPQQAPPSPSLAPPPPPRAPPDTLP